MLTPRYKLIGLGVLAIMLILIGLTYFFGIYPGGYTIKQETTTEMVVVQKSLIGSEEFIFPVTEHTELKAALMKYYVSDLINKWYVFVLVTASLLLNLLSTIQNKRLTWRYLAIILIIVLMIILSFNYTDQLDSIENLLQELKSYPSV